MVKASWNRLNAESWKPSSSSFIRTELLSRIRMTIFSPYTVGSVAKRRSMLFPPTVSPTRPS